MIRGYFPSNMLMRLIFEALKKRVDDDKISRQMGINMTSRVALRAGRIDNAF